MPHTPPRLIALLALGFSVAWAPAATPSLSALKPAATLPATIREASGLAASRRAPGVFWTHGDSGGQPVIEAIDESGRPRGRWRLQGATNVDWEDIASFTLDGQAWLLIADTGDNQAGRGDCVLYVVAEPEPGPPGATTERVLRVAWKLPVIYPDGPRDVEAVAVDAREERVYLLAKRTTPPGLYTLRLRATPPGRPVPPMERVGEVAGLPAAQGAQALLPVPAGAYRAQPTAMDFAADGSAAVVLTYGEVLVYPRNQDESWARALARAPVTLASHGLTQAEAAAFGADGRSVLVTSEGAEAPLLRYEWRR